MKRGIGTNKAEAAAKTLVRDCRAKGEPTKEQLRKSFLNNIMKTKLEDADREFKVEDFKFHKQKKRLREVVNNDAILRRAQAFSNREAEREWLKNKDKLGKKVKHLENKYRSKDNIIKDTVRGIKISDRALGPEKATPDPIIYNIDKDAVPANVKEALKLHPKFAVVKPIILAEVKTEIQKGFYKQRLSMKNEEERILAGETEEEAERNEINSHALVDDATKVINFNNLRVTDLPTNRQVGVPPLASNSVEVQMAGIEAELVQATCEYLKTKCDQKGVPKESNLSPELETGMKQAIEMQKNGNVVVTETDKSSRLCLDTLQEYVAMAEPHIRKDKVVTDKDVASIEKLMNCHSYQLCRIFGVCTAWDDGKRVKAAMTNKNLPPPSLKLSHKDHKPILPGKPAPCRPICSATISPNGQTSHLVSMVLNQLAEAYDEGTECKSKEEMIAEMNKVNAREDIEEMIVGSTDVKSLYPSLLAIPSTEIIVEVFMQTDLLIEGVNWAEVGKYLAINLSAAEINNLQLKEVVSTRSKTGGRHPGMTTAEIMGKLYREEGEEVTSLFNSPQRQPTEVEKKVMLAQVIKVAMLAVLQNHTYQFKNNEARLQSDGGPIGLELAGAMARVVMIWWDKRFLQQAALNNVELYLYKRYIDDENMAAKPLPPGTRWMEGPWLTGFGGKMVVVEALIEEDSLLPEDMRTMTEIRKMADSICPMIQFEEDYASKNEDQLLKILEFKVCVKKGEQTDRPPKPEIIYYHYYKPVSNWQLMHAKSAMPASVKRTTLTQEGLRILRNTKLDVPWSEKAEMLTDFSARLRYSGYSERYRQQVIESVLAGWDKMVKEEEEGRRPINRPREWQADKRRMDKKVKKNSWYKAGGYSTVIFCPYTPNGELAQRWRQIEARGAETRGWRFRVVERAGRQVRSLLCRNPWAGQCEDPRCAIHTTGGKGNCNRPGCTYKVQCLACKVRGPDQVPEAEEQDGERPGQGEVGVPCVSLYHGQSGYSAKTRGLDHEQDMKAKRQTNAMVRHNILYHLGRQVDYQMSVVSLHSDPISRLCREGVDIIAGGQDILLNSKEEFLQGAVPSTRAQRGFGR